MAISAEGIIEIPLEEFFNWVSERENLRGYERSFGVPKTNKINQTLEVTFALSDTCDPIDWVEKPKCLLEWKDEQKSDVPN